MEKCGDSHTQQPTWQLGHTVTTTLVVKNCMGGQMLEPQRARPGQLGHTCCNWMVDVSQTSSCCEQHTPTAWVGMHCSPKIQSLALQPWGQLQKLAQNFKGSPHFHTVFGKAGVESAVESSTLFHPKWQVCCGEFKQKCGKCASGVESQTLKTAPHASQLAFKGLCAAHPP